MVTEVTDLVGVLELLYIKAPQLDQVSRTRNLVQDQMLFQDLRYVKTVLVPLTPPLALLRCLVLVPHAQDLRTGMQDRQPHVLSEERLKIQAVKHLLRPHDHLERRCYHLHCRTRRSQGSNPRSRPCLRLRLLSSQSRYQLRLRGTRDQARLLHAMELTGLLGRSIFKSTWTVLKAIGERTASWT